jgi:AraC-like DNA-binding protein
MSRSRQLTVDDERFLTVRSFACDYGNGHRISRHSHDWHQLLYASTGSMTVNAGNLSWMIPPGKAVFIPAGCVHSIRMWGMVAMRSLALSKAVLQGECRVLSVTPLLRELILRVIDTPALDSRVEEHKRLLGVLLDEMSGATVAPLMLPLPTDTRALSVAEYVLRDPGGEEMLDGLSRRFGVGRRTLERLFREETGMSFGLWRQKARMLNSLRLLSEGQAVANVALDTGYNGASAFIAAFRSTFGCTPGRM